MGPIIYCIQYKYSSIVCAYDYSAQSLQVLNSALVQSTYVS